MEFLSQWSGELRGLHVVGSFSRFIGHAKGTNPLRGSSAAECVST
jgi:hypothetical protein